MTNELHSMTNRIERYRQYERLAPKYDSQIASIMDRASSLLEPCTGHWLTDRIEKFKWNYMKNLLVYGDVFIEKIFDDEKRYALFHFLPADSMYRIETIKGQLLEFQQSKEGPDYASIVRCPIDDVTTCDSGTAIRFLPQQIVHIKLGDDRKTYCPYGVSLIEKNPDLWNDYDAESLAAKIKDGLAKLMVDERLGLGSP